MLLAKPNYFAATPVFLSLVELFVILLTRSLKYKTTSLLLLVDDQKYQRKETNETAQTFE